MASQDPAERWLHGAAADDAIPAISAARHTRILVAGPGKAEMLAAVHEALPTCFPWLCVGGEDVQWFVDAAAASKLRNRP